MVERVTLVRQHRLTVKELFVVVLVVQSGSSRSTSTYGEIWCDSTSVIILLPFVEEEALEIALTHAWLAVSHHVDVAFRRDLTRPSHGHDFLIVLDCA